MKGNILAALMVTLFGFILIVALLSALLAAASFIAWEPWFTLEVFVAILRIGTVAGVALTVAMIFDNDGSFKSIARDLE